MDNWTTTLQQTLYHLADDRQDYWQWTAIALCLLGAVILSIILRKTLFSQNSQCNQIISRFFKSAKHIGSAPVIFCLLLWITWAARNQWSTQLVRKGHDALPSGYIHSAALLVSAFVIYRIAAAVSKGRLAPKLLGGGMLMVFALHLFGWLAPLSTALQNISLPLGNIDINLWAIIWAIAALFFMLWIAGLSTRLVDAAIQPRNDIPPSIKVLIGKATRLCLYATAILVLSGHGVTMMNNTLPLLVLVIGVTNGIYVVTRILDEVRKGKTQKTAILTGVYRVALATLLTTVTTAIGFGSLVISKSSLLRNFGVLIAIAVMLVYLCTVYLMPLILSFFRLKIRKHQEHPRLNRLMTAIARFTSQYPKMTVMIALVLLAVSLLAGTRVPIDAKVNDVFEPTHPISTDLRLVEDKLGGILPLEIDLTAAPGTFTQTEILIKLSEMEHQLSQIPSVLSTLSLTDLLAEGGVDFDDSPSQLRTNLTLAALKRIDPQQLAAFVNDDGSNTHISIRLPDRGIKNAMTIIRQIDKTCREFTQATPEINYDGPENGTNRIKRGGSYDSESIDLQVGKRSPISPDHKSGKIGFRVVRCP